MTVIEPGRFAGSDMTVLIRDGYMASQKARMAHAVEFRDAVPKSSDIFEIADEIVHQTGIMIQPERFLEILSLFPIARGNLAHWGWGDTEVQDEILDVLASYLAGTRWPRGIDGVNLGSFVGNLRRAAVEMGFEVTLNAPRYD